MTNPRDIYPTTNVRRGTTRVRIIDGRSLHFEVYECGEPAGSGGDIRFVPEHIRGDVEARLLSPRDGLLWRRPRRRKIPSMTDEERQRDALNALANESKWPALVERLKELEAEGFDSRAVLSAKNLRGLEAYERAVEAVGAS